MLINSTFLVLKCKGLNNYCSPIFDLFLLILSEIREISLRTISFENLETGRLRIQQLDRTFGNLQNFDRERFPSYDPYKTFSLIKK